MVLLSLIGNSLIVFAPILAVFFGLVFVYPQLVVISVISSFFYIISLSFTSIFWMILPVKTKELAGITVGFGVLVSEFIRWMFYYFYLKADAGFLKANKHNLFDSEYGMVPIALSGGIGYAISRALITFGAVLAMNLGPGTLYSPTCSAINFFTACSLSILFVEIIDVGLMIVAFQGYSNRSWISIGVVFVIHLGTSGITALNILPNSCYYTLPCLAIISVLITVIWILSSIRDERRRAQKKIEMSQ